VTATGGGTLTYDDDEVEGLVVNWNNDDDSSANMTYGPLSR